MTQSCHERFQRKRQNGRPRAVSSMTRLGARYSGRRTQKTATWRRWSTAKSKPELADPTDVAEDLDEPSAQSGAQAFGKPFRIEWLATNRLPFYRTRGLRNPWNANREVKIARDGTELEPSVGKRLLQMFHGIPPESGQQAGWPQQY